MIIDYNIFHVYFQLHAGPGTYPPGLTALLTESTWIKFSWRKLPCVKQNGPITGYRFELYRDHEKVLSGTLPGADSTEFTADCLKPDAQYKFRVAAVNDAGTGDFSPLVEAGTDELDPEAADISIDLASGRVHYTCQTKRIPESLI